MPLHKRMRMSRSLWPIKDGFWRLDCEDGEEWNFAYVLPQEEGQPVKLVVPTSLQMGWIESPPYFCAAAETGRDVAVDYVETAFGSVEAHKFQKYSASGKDFESLPKTSTDGKLSYLVECYVDDYISLAIPTSQEQLEHVANAVMTGIHDVFPADENDEEDPISLKKLRKLESMWMVMKDILGFTFDGVNKTIWLEKPKRDALLEKLRGWIYGKQRRERVGFRLRTSSLESPNYATPSSPSQMARDSSLPVTSS